MAIANYYEQKPLNIFTFKKLCNGEQRLAAQHMHCNDVLRPSWQQAHASTYFNHTRAIATVAWPSGLRRWFKAPVSSEARVRISPLPFKLF